jgi:hypothetical protein
VGIASPPEWRPIAKAIRSCLRHTYAPRKLGLTTELPPLRLSTYTGKGVGHYATGADGRADWSGEFYAHIARIERRTDPDPELRFGYDELEAAMNQLAARYPQWFTVLTAVDVHGVGIEEYCVEAGRDLPTVKRQRNKATLFVYHALRLNWFTEADRVAVVVTRVK